MRYNNLLFYYLLTHITFLVILCILYFAGELYFGYELGDLLIVLMIVLFIIISVVTMFFHKQLPLPVSLLIVAIFTILDIRIICLI
jgi:hypothetical protein